MVLHTLPPVPSPLAKYPVSLSKTWGSMTRTEVTTLDPSYKPGSEQGIVKKKSTYMKSLMTRWNLEPLYPYPSSLPSLVLPVAKARKFSTVLGTVYNW